MALGTSGGTGRAWCGQGRAGGRSSLSKNGVRELTGLVDRLPSSEGRNSSWGSEALLRDSKLKMRAIEGISWSMALKVWDRSGMTVWEKTEWVFTHWKAS